MKTLIKNIKEIVGVSTNENTNIKSGNKLKDILSVSDGWIMIENNIITSNEKDLGKTTDLDSKQGKVNFVTLLGLEKSRKKVEDLIIQAKSELEKFSVNTENLMKIAEFVETRKN